MKSFKEKIEANEGPRSNWKEQVKDRKANPWRTYSFEIACRILAIIEDDKNLTQAKLAEILNVSPQQVNKIVQGTENLTLETIYKLSQALQVELITFPPYKYSVPLKKGRKKQESPDQ